MNPVTIILVALIAVLEISIWVERRSTNRLLQDLNRNLSLVHAIAEEKKREPEESAAYWRELRGQDEEDNLRDQAT